MKLKIYIDEAGRGPLAGPLYVGLVLPLQKFSKKHYKDSKLLSQKQREVCFQKISISENKNQILFAYGSVDAGYIDDQGLTKALNQSILIGLQDILKKIYIQYISPVAKTSLCSCDHMYNYTLQNIFQEQKILASDIQKIVNMYKEYGISLELFIDGNRTFGLDKDLGIPVETIIDGDFLVPEISMASIVAKVLRDRKMVELDKEFPL